MAFDFPNNPSLNDEVTFGTITYVWNGTSWESGSTGLSYAEVANRIDFTSNRANVAFELANNSSLWAVRQSFVATANQSVFNISTGYLPNYVDVFYNGIKLYDGDDYTANNGSSVILTNPAPVNTVIEVLSFGANVSTTNLYVLASATGFSSRQTFTATEGQTTYNPTGGYRVGYIDVFYNGIKMNIPSDVTANNGTDVVFIGLTPTAGDTIETIVITPDVSIANAVPVTGGTISGDITVAGNILPSSTNTHFLGSESKRWHSLFVNSNSIDIDGLVLSNQNGTLAVSSGGAEPTPIAGEDTWVRDHANAAFAAANNVGPQIEPAFAQANAAFEAANSVNVYDANTISTGYFSLPAGNTAQRPSETANGYIRFNTSINGGSLEAFLNGSWVTFVSSTLSAGFLLVAGGGGGGARIGGGGGAGGVLYASGNISTTSGTTYTVTVGAGGAGGNPGSYQVANATQGFAGSDSTFGSYIAYGGGGGGATDGFAGMVGGSGGGGGRPQFSAGGGASQTSQGVAVGYGNNGGTGSRSPSADRSGGGGGAGAAGATGAASGNGGIGIVNPLQTYVQLGQLSGSDYYIGGGGAGAGYPSGSGTGGLGGGANAGPTVGTAGTTNTGGGGGGGVYDGGSGHAGGAGGSGFVIIFYQAQTQRATGGSVTIHEDGGIKLYFHTFTSTGSFSFIT